MKNYSLKDLIDMCTQKLQERSAEKRVAQLEAWWLLEHVAKKQRAFLLTQKTISLTDLEHEQLHEFIRQRVEDKKPLQYILGNVNFCDVELFIKPPTLIPRPETEEIVEWLLERIQLYDQNELAILDLCTGSGCIALALAKALPQAQITAIDIQTSAIALAQKNAQHNSITNITIMQSDLYQALEPNHQFDLIISNPPYLSYKSYEQVEDELRLWEDKAALVAEDAGMALYKRIVMHARNYLKDPVTTVHLPQLVLEIGKDQVGLEEFIMQNGFSRAETNVDMSGLNRWIAAYV